MNRLVRAVAAPAVLSVSLGGLAACGGSSTPGASGNAAAAAAPATSSAPPPLTCTTTTSDNSETASQVITTLVSDQRSQDASQEQNWVNLVDGSQTSQGDDLAAAAQSLGSYSGTTLAADASKFATDANTFLSDESGGLMPGWVTDYRAVQNDVATIAGDCGQAYAVPSS